MVSPQEKWNAELRKREHYRELAEYGVGPEDIQAKQAAFTALGASLGWNPGCKLWSIFLVNKAGEPGGDTITLWLGAGELVRYIQDPEATVALMRQKIRTA